VKEKYLWRVRPFPDHYTVNGDGSLLGTAALPVVAAESPENLTIVCLDNGAFGSTGNQPTPASGQVDMELLAIAGGIRRTCKVQDERELREAWRTGAGGRPSSMWSSRPGTRRSETSRLPRGRSGSGLCGRCGSEASPGVPILIVPSWICFIPNNDGNQPGTARYTPHHESERGAFSCPVPSPHIPD